MELLHLRQGRLGLGLRRRHVTFRARRLGLLHEAEGLAGARLRTGERPRRLHILTTRALDVLTAGGLNVLPTRPLDVLPTRDLARRPPGVRILRPPAQLNAALPPAGPDRPAPRGSGPSGHAGSGRPGPAGTGRPDHAGSGCPDRAATGCPGHAATRSGARPRASAAPGRCQPSPSACSAVPWPSRLRAGTTRSGPRRSPWQTWRSRRRSSSLQALSSCRPFQLVRGGLTGATPIGRRPISSPRIYSCDARTVVPVPETIGRGVSNAAAKGQREVYRSELQVVVIHGARVKRALCPAGSDRVARQNARPPSKGPTDEAKAKDACR